MKKSLNSICALYFAAFIALPLAALPATVQADSMSSYSNQPGDAQARREAKERANYLSEANEHSLAYLGQARQFREQGRYELARQRYLQALSICADDQTLSVIKRELNGIELLLRTMR
ncbi:hypothetical protein [Desulfovibrio sp.]|uniref:hypothetical protein n=1 Tax=Desulfovibrio sp. TaxID=885 RepID=UPI0035AF3FB2